MSWLWNAMYRGRPSWDLSRPDPVLVRTLDDKAVPPGRAIDLGCGTGDNAIELACRGFDVVGVDLASRALDRAREKARDAGVAVDLRLATVTSEDGLGGPYDLVVDRGLLMSLRGERARRAYTDVVDALVASQGHVYENQWVLPEAPRLASRAWLATKTKSVVMSPGELERRFGDRYRIELMSRSIEEPADRFMRTMLGLRRVAEESYWLTRLDG